jgi:hypothetical protein
MIYKFKKWEDGTTSPSRKIAVTGDMQLKATYTEIAREYHTHETLTTDLTTLANNHPELCKLTSTGKSVNGKDLWCLQIGLNDQNPAIVIMGAHHGNEKIAVEIAYLWAEYLLSNYETNAEVKKIVDGLRTFIIPMPNPDGNSQYTRKNAHGVDLNRNYSFHWCEAGSSTDPNSDIFKGTQPFTEPETIAIKTFIETLKPIWSISYHSGTEILAYPWGYTQTYPPDKAEYDALLQQIKQHTTERGYTPYSGGQISWERRPPFTDFGKELVIYEASGVYEDFIYNIGLKNFVLEISSYYTPPAEDIEWYFNRQLSLPLLVSLHALGEQPPEPRKGLPSKSTSITAQVAPPPTGKEPTTLTLTFDKTEYTSEDPMILTGKLNFTSDSAPLEGRTVSILQDSVEVATATTDSNGNYTLHLTAPTVTVQKQFTYLAHFAGDA